MHKSYRIIKKNDKSKRSGQNRGGLKREKSKNEWRVWMQPMDEVYQKYAQTVYRFLLSKVHDQDIEEE